MPRWPSMIVTGGPLPSPHSGRYLVVPEPMTPSLEDDLRRWPLHQRRRERAIQPTVRVAKDGARIALAAPLAADTAHTLVVGPPTGEGACVGFELRTDQDPQGGVSVVASMPGDGHSQVPTHLPRIGIVTNDALVSPAVTLRGPAGDVVEVSLSGGRCGKASEYCYEASLPSSLPVGPHTIHLASPLDAQGNRPMPFQARFDVVEGAPVSAPAVLHTPCTPDETATEAGFCVLIHDTWLRVRGRFDRAAYVDILDLSTRAEVEEGALLNTTASPRGEFALEVGSLEPESSLRLALRATSLAGTSAFWPLELTTRASLPTVAITESRANPRGPEPAQEYVELLNYGAAPVRLDGYLLSDDAFKIGDALPDGVVLLPLERVLVVPESFDPDDASDKPPVPASTRLLRVDESLGAGGLSNRGEPLFLRDSEGRRISEFVSFPVEEGRCAHRIQGGGAESVECSPGR